MPVVFRQGRRRFHFYADEGTPREPAHIHVDGPDGKAKFWLRPDVRIANAKGYDVKTLNTLVALVEARREEIEKVWDEFFSKAGSF